jgi:hypothetical protein
MSTSQNTYCKFSNIQITLGMGNVLCPFDFSQMSTATDKKIPHTANGTEIDYCLADITSAGDSVKCYSCQYIV